MAIDHPGLRTAVKRLARIARAAGALYLLVAVLGGVAQLVAPAGIHPPGATTATAEHIDAQPVTSPVSVLADVVMAIAFVIVGAALHLLFRHIDRHAAGTTVVFVTVSAGMVVVNLLFHHAALLGGADPPHNALGAQTSGGLVARLLDMHDHGYTMAGISFGLCLLSLGYLAHRSSRIPSVLSTLLIVSWVLDTLLGLLWPDVPAVIRMIIAPPPVADLWLTLYMVAKGVLVPRRDQTAAASVEADHAAAARPTPSCDASQATARSDGHAPGRWQTTTGSS